MTAIVAFMPLGLEHHPADRGISDDALLLRRSLAEASLAAPTVSRGGLERALVGVLSEATRDNWDGSGGKAVSKSTATYAQSLLAVLPYTDFLPDVQADAQGDIILEWYVSPGWVFSVAINEHGNIAYSGLFGGSRTRGIEIFHGNLPMAISLGIARINDRQKVVQA